MTPERVKEIARNVLSKLESDPEKLPENVFDVDWDTPGIGSMTIEEMFESIESAIRQAVNEALEEAANMLDAEDFAGAAVLGSRVRALKLPEE